MRSDLLELMQSHSQSRCEIAVLLLEADVLLARARDAAILREDLGLRQLSDVLQKVIDALAADHSDTGFHLTQIEEALGEGPGGGPGRGAGGGDFN